MTKTSFQTKLKLCFLSICAIILLFPMVYTFLNSFRLDFNKGIIPIQWGLKGYFEVFLRRPDYLIKFWNSLILTGSIVIGQLIVSCLAGYGFSRFEFPGKEILFFVVIILMLMPYQVTLVSNYIVVDRLNLTNTYLAIILPGIFSPFGVFLMRQAFDAYPGEYREAAMLDGANQICIMRKIMLPGCKSALAALILLSFVDSWNMVEQPLVFLKDSINYPLSVFLAQMNESNIGILCTYGILAAIPVLLLFFYCDEDLVDGISLIKI